MLIQTSLPDSIGVALSFVSDDGKQNPLCDMDRGWGQSLILTKGKKDNHDSCPLDSTSCSQLSSLTTIMSENSLRTLVYQRRKPHKHSVASSSAQELASTYASNACSRDPLILKSESSKEYPKNKIVEVNDSCSSSQSNMKNGSASMKNQMDEMGECSSSSILNVEINCQDLSERDFCISILRSQGLLKGVCPMRTPDSSETRADENSSDKDCCFRSCKVCGHSETALNMLVCDHCEEAFHVYCCNPRVKKLPVDEWFCHSCFKRKHKILKGRNSKGSSEMGICKNATSKSQSGHIEVMLKDSAPYTTGVRIGKAFQAEVPDWSGPIASYDIIGEAVEINPSEFVSKHEFHMNKPTRLSSIGNWLQCREVIDGVGEGIDGTVCGKWRRVPLFEVQTTNWECFNCVLWDPAHSDCAVPQEVETEEVLKHLKYIEMLRPRLAAKKRKVGGTKSGDDTKDHIQDVQKNIISAEDS